MTGESRDYKFDDGDFGRVNPINTWGAVELALRYSTIDLNDGPVSGGEEENITFGLNWYVHPHARLMINYIVVDNDKNADGDGDITGNDSPRILLGRKLLEKLGYVVITAQGGKPAITELLANRNRIDMIILDMIMPDMNGAEAYDHLKEIKPEAKVMLSSGYSINRQAEEILAKGCNGFIQKPFTLKELSKKIRSILDVN